MICFFFRSRVKGGGGLGFKSPHLTILLYIWLGMIMNDSGAIEDFAFCKERRGEERDGFMQSVQGRKIEHFG